MKSSNSLLRRVGSLVLASTLVVAACPPLALAESTPADKASARDFMRDGKELRAKGDHAGALKKFRAAYSLVPTPITGVAVAQEQVAVGQLVEARETLGEIERMPAKATESDEGRKAREDATALHAQIAPKIPTLEISVKGLAAGKSVVLTVDGAPVPAVAAEQGIRVNPGAHVVVAKVDAEERTKSVDLKEGQRAKVELDFSAVAAPKPPETPKPIEPPVTTSPVTPPTTALSPGTPATVDTGSSGSGQRTAGLVLAVGGVVLGGVGGYLAFKGNDQFKNPGDDMGVCDTTCQSNQSAGQSKTRIGVGLIVVGAAAAVTGVVLYLVAPKSASGGPTVGVTPGGLVFRTTF